MALHTSGDLLNWHPHIHAIALNGSVLDDGHFLELTDLDTAALERRFKENVFTALREHELITEDTVDVMNSWEHSGFNVYAAEPIKADDEDARLFLARYLKKAPLAESRLSLDESGIEPTVVYQKTTDDGEQTRRFSPLAFLAELSPHIPNTFEQTTRMYGVYSSSTRGKAAREARYQEMVQNNFQPLADEPPPRTASASFARCMKRVFEIDPLRCCKCGETMKVVAFVHSPSEIEKLARSLGRPTWRAPPPFTPAGIRLDTSAEYSQIYP
jgi:hypothetical protein